METWIKLKCGVLYRVYPYAEPRDDWLDLDGIALATQGYKMNRKQLVGAVRISSRGNPYLQDQTVMPP